MERFLEGKGALITGGASGFGKGVAFEYAKRGADLVLVDINENMLEETSKLIETETKQKVIPITCDVSQANQVKKMSKQAFEELDNIFILFNNAGIGPGYGKDILKVDEKIWNSTIDVNLKGQWLVSKFICRNMRKQSFEPLAGKVIHTSSDMGMVVDITVPVYCISKAGIITLMQLLAKTLAPKIAVNAISPGYHVTGIYANSEETMVKTMKIGNVKTPLNRVGTVEDIVNIALFLASSASNFITGHNFVIDGGIVEVGVPANYLKTDF
ncbi:MAG: SDR family oxidoreductase [Promethearchaeota archaeon]|nr:MAG: SDR family oxidoreductase [Candidatus Lokiarchaeota archaeon]